MKYGEKDGGVIFLYFRGNRANASLRVSQRLLQPGLFSSLAILPLAQSFYK